MKRNRLLFAIAVSFGLLGCTMRPLPLATLGDAAMTPINGGTAGLTAGDQAATPVARYGSLVLNVRWPERSGFHTALIPDTTAALVISVASGSSVIKQHVVTRLAGQATASATIELPAANALGVTVKAYRETAPNPGTDVPIAENSAVVNIVSSRDTYANIVLNPLFVPTLTGMSTNVGKTGTTVTLTGTNFGSGAVPTPTVAFNGVSATSVTRNSATSLTVVVPSGAFTGNVVVKADGVPSTSSAPFWVLADFQIEAPRQTWDSSPSSSRMVLYGQTLQFTGREAWVVKAGETAGQYGTPPSFTWTTSNPAAGTLDGNGLFTAASAYATSSIEATFGSITSNLLEVRAVGVDSVALSQSSLTLNALPEAGNADPGYVTSATLTATVQTTAPFNGGVVWSSSDTSRVTVSNGFIQTVAGAPEGTATITATSFDDPTRKATASVTVTIMGDLELGIE